MTVEVLLLVDVLVAAEKLVVGLVAEQLQSMPGSWWR